MCLVRASVACLLVATFSCNEPNLDGPTLGERSVALNGGAPENGHPGTVLMYWTDGRSGILCSGTVVAPRVIVSAKHCYLPTGVDGWTANTGPTGQTQSLGVIDILMPPGDELLNEDIAVVVLGQDINVDPVDMRRDLSDMRVGDSVTLVGYGENPDDGDSGRKYSGEADIIGFGPIDEAGVGDQEILIEGAAACGGDSGGSTLDGAGDLVAVIVRGADVGCDESTFTVSTRLDGFLGLIDQGIEQSQGCVPTGAEVCNSADDNCDGVVDENCAGFLGPCADSVPCQPPYDCVFFNEGVGSRCSLVCDPSVPLESCFPGNYCYANGCGADAGVCYARTFSETHPIGTACERDDDCETFFCRDPGDGAGMRCLQRCEEDATCGAGSACVPIELGCGGCVSVGGDPLLLGFGQPCTGDAECASGLCGSDEDGRFCTQACGDCPPEYHCARDVCARGEESDDQGRPCVDNEDCLTGLCAHWPEGASCTSRCSEADPCPVDLTCTDTGDGAAACKPDRTIVGQPCEGNDECLSSLCGSFDDDRGTVCTEPCGAGGTCPPELECVEASGVTLCAPPSVPPEESTYGCGCTVLQSPSPVGGLAFLVGALVVFRRRRAQS